MEDLKRDWPVYCCWGGAATVLTFGWFMLTAADPWAESERGLAPGKWLQVSMPGRKETHWATYEYEVEGHPYRGEYRCEGCLRGMAETPARGVAMSVEYRLANPAVSRPAGLVTQGAARYRRVGLIAGIALLAAGLAGMAFRRSTRENP